MRSSMMCTEMYISVNTSKVYIFSFLNHIYSQTDDCVSAQIRDIYSRTLKEVQWLLKMVFMRPTERRSEGPIREKRREQNELSRQDQSRADKKRKRKSLSGRSERWPHRSGENAAEHIQRCQRRSARSHMSHTVPIFDSGGETPLASGRSPANRNPAWR